MESTNSKKRKIIDYENINLDDYINIDLDKYRKYLQSKMYEYEEKAKKTKGEIKEINKLIAKKCKETKGHKWVSEREPYMYGERFTYCEYCRADYYDNSYYH